MTVFNLLCFVLLTISAILATPIDEKNPRDNIIVIIKSPETIKSPPSPKVSWKDKTLLTYRSGSFAGDKKIRQNQETTINSAFNIWSKYIPITFNRVCETCPADIVIEFVRHPTHNQTFYCDLDNSKNTVSSKMTDPVIIYLNSSNTFNNRALFYAAIHKIGHALGLMDNSTYNDSVMSLTYLKLNNRIKRDGLPSIDQKAIQKIYGKREDSTIIPCSTWSTQPEHKNRILDNSHDFFVKKYLEEQNELNHVISQDLQKWNNNEDSKCPFNSYKDINDTLNSIRATIKPNRVKVSNGIAKDAYGQLRAINFDQSNKLYLTDYVNNRILICAGTNQRVIRSNLNGPRALYVTSDNSYLYVVDNKGVRLFRLDPKWSNSTTSTLLFDLEPSLEIYNIIVDEEDFHTIYLYETRNMQIRQCRLHPKRECKIIVNLRNNTNDLTQQMSMVIDHEGALVVFDNVKRGILQYKHFKKQCVDPNAYNDVNKSYSISRLVKHLLREKSVI